MQRLKEAFVYSVSDPNWIKKVGRFWLYYVLYLTLPCLFGYFFRVLGRNLEDPEDDELPPFDNIGNLWWTGFCRYLQLGLPLVIPCSLNMMVFGAVAASSFRAPQSEFPAQFYIFFGIHGLITLTLFFLFPAYCLQLAMTSDWRSLFRFQETRKVIGGNPLAYLGLVAVMWLAFPAALVAMMLSVVGLLLIIPSVPLMMFAYARLLALYYHDYLAETGK